MKRFTDSAIWDKLWFMRLSATEKAAFMYILSKCDCIGIWDINDILLAACTGYKGDMKTLAKKTNNNIEMFGKDKIWLPGFCSFQYGDLKETCPPHRKYISELKKRSLFERVAKGYRKGLNTLQEEEEEEEQDKEEEKEKEKEEERSKKAKPKKAAYGEHGKVMLTDVEYNQLLKKHGEVKALDGIDTLGAWLLSTGKYRPSHYGCLDVRSWVWEKIADAAKADSKQTTNHKELPKGKAELSRGWID